MKKSLLKMSIIIFTPSTDSTVSSFVDSSEQYRGMRPNMMAMKNKNSQSQNLNVPCQGAQTGKPVSNARCKQRRHYPKRVLNQTRSKGAKYSNCIISN